MCQAVGITNQKINKKEVRFGLTTISLQISSLPSCRNIFTCGFQREREGREQKKKTHFTVHNEKNSQSQICEFLSMVDAHTKKQPKNRIDTTVDLRHN